MLLSQTLRCGFSTEPVQSLSSLSLSRFVYHQSSCAPRFLFHSRSSSYNPRTSKSDCPTQDRSSKASRCRRPRVSPEDHARLNRFLADTVKPPPPPTPKSKGPPSITKRYSYCSSYPMQRNPCTVRFVTTPTADTPGAALLLTFDSPPKSYLFGHVGEGLQRAAGQNGVRLSRINDVFFTGRTGWSGIGGTLGMVLSAADVLLTRTRAQTDSLARRIESVRHGPAPDPTQRASVVAHLERQMQEAAAGIRISLHGGRNLTHFVATARRFIFRKGVPLDVTEYTAEDSRPPSNADAGIPDPAFKDANIKVWPVVVRPEGCDPPHGRKRSLDEAEGRVDAGRTPTPSRERAGEDDRQRRAAVTAMFGSNWSKDALEERRLVDVEMPAKLFVRDPKTKDLKPYNGPMPGGDVDVSNVTVLVRKPWPGANIHGLPPTTPSADALSYVVHQFEQRGRFMAKKAKELGLPNGPLYRELAMGNSVTLPNGQTITPDMVLEPPRQANGFAVLDVPGLEYVRPLLERAEWTDPRYMKGVTAFVWLLGPGVAASPEIRRFMEERSGLHHIVSSPDVGRNRISMDASATSTAKLQALDPKRFELPHSDDVPLSAALGVASLAPDLPGFVTVADRGTTLRLEPRLELFHEEVLPPWDPNRAVANLAPRVLELAQEARANINADRAALDAWRATIPDPDTEIVTLGTGSALPSNHRNVSATLVRVPGVGSYLLDCGEGTLGQIKRVYGRKYTEVIRDLRLIWISHLHADHHLGTANVVREWYALVHGSVPDPAPFSVDTLRRDVAAGTLARRLAVVSEIDMHQWLAEYAQVEDIGHSRLLPLLAPTSAPYLRLVTFHPSSSPSSSPARSSSPSTGSPPITHTLAPILSHPPLLPALTGLHHLAATHVRHCRHANAVALTFPSGLKIAYSGDCRPSARFAALGAGATVCVHEATFGDELRGEARAKLHSTSGEAVAVARAMGARVALLTHFSQRYAKVVNWGEAGVEIGGDEEVGGEAEGDVPIEEEGPVDAPVDEGGPGPMAETERVVGRAESPDVVMVDAKETDGNVGAGGSDTRVAVAFDYMRVKVGELAELQYFLPALNELSNEPEKEDGEDDAEAEDAGLENPVTAEPQPTSGKKGKKHGSGGGKDGEAGKSKAEVLRMVEERRAEKARKKAEARRKSMEAQARKREGDTGGTRTAEKGEH